MLGYCRTIAKPSTSISAASTVCGAHTASIKLQTLGEGLGQHDIRDRTPNIGKLGSKEDTYTIAKGETCPRLEADAALVVKSLAK